MRVIGVDFSSAPGRRKPIVAVTCELDEGAARLHYRHTQALHDLAAFEALLGAPGPWIAGLDFPFGQARRFIETIGWPPDWAGYVAHAGALGRQGFRAALDAYRLPRAPGDKEHARRDDRAAGSISPQKLYGVPVGLMFLEGAPRLLASGATVPGLQAGDAQRIVVEAYPGALARHLVGRVPYKNDTRAKQTPQLRTARVRLLDAVRDDGLHGTHALRVSAPDRLADDPMADELDALLCAVQAGWAWTRRAHGFGRPPDADPLEGWIAEATLPGRG